MSSPSQDPLMVTISGIRGISGTSFTPAVIVKYVSAFATMQKGTKVILGRDSRCSGPWVLRIVQGVLAAFGLQIIDVGIVPTPTVQFMVQEKQADAGGIVITSSHNPVQWNGLKFVDRDGLFISPEKCEQMFKIADDGVFNYNKTPSSTIENLFASCGTAQDEHVAATLGLPYVDVEKIKIKKFKVCLDTVNGAGGPIMQKLLQALGCEVVGMNLEPTGVFAHTPEPVPENLGELCSAVLAHNADLGVATDPDVDRCVLIDEKGKPLGEEYTLAFAVKLVVGHFKKQGPVVKNLSSSRAVDDIAKEHNCPVINTPVGEIQVAKKMVEVNAVIGGEGNGGVMLPDLHIGRDALVAAALALQLLALHGGTISELKATLPQYEIVKLKAPIAGIDPDSVVAHFKEKWQGKAQLNDEDGLRIDAEDWWVHLRKSNTEPIIRVIGEGGDYASSMRICTEILDEIKSLSQ